MHFSPELPLRKLTVGLLVCLLRIRLPTVPSFELSLRPSGGIPVERIVTTELIFRPSEKPEVAEWDLTPGREGFILRGSQPGRVILWAQHRDNPMPQLVQ